MSMPPLPPIPRFLRRRRSRFALSPLAAALSLGAAQAQEQAPAAPPVELRPATGLQTPGKGESTKGLPIILQADKISGRPDLETVAEGHAEFRQGGMTIRADRLSYDEADDLAHATGNVHATNQGNVYSGNELQLHLQAFDGFFLQPTYFLALTGGGGQAERIDFIDENRATLTQATYSSCRPDGDGAPAWLLTASSINVDMATNEGRASGAVLRFYDVPILALPLLTFPLTDTRKSGWLPPTVTLFDSKNGPSIEMPYYWNIAPQRDATITPTVIAKRGAGADVQFRYLEPNFSGVDEINALPNDQLAGRSRWSLNLTHDGTAGSGITYDARVLRVSDDAYWKDFSTFDTNLTPRLLPTDLKINRDWMPNQSQGDWSTYARLQQWQVLQTADPTAPIIAPYQRSPQIGTRYNKLGWSGLDVLLETEYNRFTLPDGNLNPTRPNGSRVHALGSVSHTFGTPGWNLVPRVSFNAASYSLDRPDSSGRTSESRVIPTVSLDGGFTFERDTTLFGKQVLQTLEPRLLYVNTPYHQQSNLPNFDSAPLDFNFESLFTDNTFSGVDRVSDADQVTAGVTTRFIDSASGVETLRLGAAQRYLFHDQRVTPDDGAPLSKGFSDVLLLGSTNLISKWTLGASVQYSPDVGRTSRSLLSATWSPSPFHTISASYNFARSASEQIIFGWQWPIFHANVSRSKLAESMAANSQCSGTAYAVGRVVYDKFDSRITDAIAGIEYDAGCWIGRLVMERSSTGTTESATKLMFQIEFVGLSRLGSNPLKVLKDNVPGYRMLREDRTTPVAIPTFD